MFSKRVYTALNIGIVFCNFVESYLFPFAVVKWMIVIIKYSGLRPWLKLGCTDKTEVVSKTRFKYSLQLMTSQSQHANCDKFRESYLTQLSFVTVTASNKGDDKEQTQLSYQCGPDCSKIPPALGKMYGNKVQCLDLSYNGIETLKGLSEFARLEELILDNNKLGDNAELPHLPRLRTLSLNNNQFEDLEGLLDKIRLRLPALSYLSLLSNKACPDQLSDRDKDDSDYQRYRYFVIYKLPSLRFLDSRLVSPSERSEALKRGEFTRVRRPRDVTDAPSAAPAPPARPLPVDLAALGKHKGAYGKCHYKYTGKHSEGNRFIVNSDL